VNAIWGAHEELPARYGRPPLQAGRISRALPAVRNVVRVPQSQAPHPRPEHPRWMIFFGRLRRPARRASAALRESIRNQSEQDQFRRILLEESPFRARKTNVLPPAGRRRRYIPHWSPPRDSKGNDLPTQRPRPLPRSFLSWVRARPRSVWVFDPSKCADGLPIRSKPGVGPKIATAGPWPERRSEGENGRPPPKKLTRLWAVPARLALSAVGWRACRAVDGDPSTPGRGHDPLSIRPRVD